MAAEDAQAHSDSPKKKRKGFQVGPARRAGQYSGHTDKIKRTLVHKAKVKRAYAKELVRSGYTQADNDQEPADEVAADESAKGNGGNLQQPGNRIHPSRQASVKGKERAVTLPRPNYRERKQNDDGVATASPAPPSRFKKSPEEIDALREQRKRDNTAWMKRRPDGRINQAARIQVLLGRIERSMGKEKR